MAEVEVVVVLLAVVAVLPVAAEVLPVAVLEVVLRSSS